MIKMEHYLKLDTVDLPGSNNVEDARELSELYGGRVFSLSNRPNDVVTLDVVLKDAESFKQLKIKISKDYRHKLRESF